MVAASVDELGVCPGVGPKKVRRLYEAFHRPFSTELVKRRKERESGKEEKELSKLTKEETPTQNQFDP
jgi:DNA excision repair protein ERCC-1